MGGSQELTPTWARFARYRPRLRLGNFPTHPSNNFSRLPYVPSSLQANPRGDSHHRPLNTALKLNIDEAYIIIFSVTHFFLKFFRRRLVTYCSSQRAYPRDRWRGFSPQSPRPPAHPLRFLEKSSVKTIGGRFIVPQVPSSPYAGAPSSPLRAADGWPHPSLTR